ncbi:MAG: leucine-rich repeat domain-containing protein [Methanomicrobiales archaeon]|nr:leucine-rich repeat domain-containing protein [Methanomicrobiales archaeon]
MKKIDLCAAHGERAVAFGRILMCCLIFCMLLSAVPAGVAAASEVVSFPDASLEAAVRDALGKPGGDITADDMATLDILDADDEEISELSGLEYAVNLRVLDLESNEIGDLGPLVNLTGLRDLDLESNEIGDLGPLANLTGLRDLDLESNEISDLGPLANLTGLRDLDLESNEIGDLSPLVANSGLGPGDSVDLRRNYLDLTPGSAAMSDIETLEKRGVDVRYIPQHR